ncbi:fluoride efflux transporter CrcB [Halobacterium sp. R2-5]|uniref:fluoride efflux transporter CrcB n=1 Tax=Halobacterium sp. R2-5 TaxID=2715751 RepID=UPI0014220D9C|nr:fluoride efflux transporter CrcB [Halobacterium sp. R2-5]NIC00867.1 fluoride efflux transporter CrcB [Halobacterium sp. R2-5]
MSDDHPLQTIETLLLVAVGGAIGANLRYVVGITLPGLWGTFTANVTGCFLLGLLLYEDRYISILADRSRVVFGTGLLSSYTTYSAFAVETVQTAPVWAIVNVVANYAIGLAAVLLARSVTLRLSGETREVSRS